MAFQVSPGVDVSEVDLTTTVPQVSASDGAIAGVFRWGPVGERILVDSENALVSSFATPTNFNAETWFTAANFLSYSNRLYVSRAADTSGATPFVAFSATTNSVATSVFTGNTTTLSVGMYVTQTSNASVLTSGKNVTIVSKNSTAVVMSRAPSVNGSVTLYFGRPETAYSAVGFDAANSSAKAANLVNQIVRNKNEYVNKDGNFDRDVVYVAKYPGDIGNSLRISVCDNANSFASNIALANATLVSSLQFNIGSNVAKVKIPDATNSAFATTVAAGISYGDQVLAGNSSIGLQYLQVRGVAVNTLSLDSVSFTGTTDINANLNFINVPNNQYTNGDIVTFTGTATYIGTGNNYIVTQANSTGFKLSNSSTSEITLAANGSGSFAANTSLVNITFEDPYRLRAAYSSNVLSRYWEFFNVVDVAPGQSEYQLYNGNTAAQDELHVVVVDNGGSFTGTPGSILEVFSGVSRASDAKSVDGTGNYYKDVINQGSRYIWWAADRSVALSNTASNLASSTATAPLNIQMALGADGLNEAETSLSVLGTAYDMFAAAEDIDISLILQGKPLGGTTVVGGETVQNFQLANYIIDNICDIRRDCVALISPDKSVVLNNVGREALSLKAWRGAVHSSSYAVLDSGYKYQYDKYNDIYRWVPLNGDIGGLCVRTDNTNDAWWSPAGFNRGQIKNLVKLAFNPRKSERDVLYSNGINPVVTFPGQGTVLFGDKTLQAKPSAFDHINVRRLFIVLEKAISTAAKYSLFEFNDSFTRAQFRNLVTPYLRTVKGRRGITDFYVVCDETNNTPNIIDSNQFIGDIYIKPARSINYIKLNFVAVPTGVQFSEVVGKF